MKKIIVFLLFAHASMGQSYNHATVWSRLLLSKQVGKWIFTGDVAFRGQNDFRSSKYNFLQLRQTDAERLTVGYRSKNWLFSFSASRWFAYPLYGKESDFQKLPTTEWRYTPGAEYFQKIKKSTLQLRTQYEYRSFVDRTAGRFRERIQFRQPLSKTNDLVFLQEFLFGIPPNPTKKFDQNQTGVTFNHFFTKQLESEIGYRYIYRKRRNSTETDNENALVVGLMLRL